MRIVDHPVLGTIENEKTISFYFNGTAYSAIEGESIAAALLASGVRTLRWTKKEGKPRGIYCGIGHCYECRVMVNGVRGVRACLTPLTEGMSVETEGSGRNEG